jgi:hypothetical protein
MCALLSAGVAEAQSPAQALLDNRFVVNLGGFVFETETTARLDGSSTTNPDIDFDRTFGKPSDARRLRADALWRITPRHHLRFMYFDNSIDRARALDETITWGDATFRAGATVQSQTEFKIAELAYEYAFVRQPTYEVAGSLGVHYTELSMQMSGVGSITDANGNVSQASFTTEKSDLSVPLPVIGLRAGWVVAPHWYVDAQGQIFKVKIDSYDARVSDLRVGATWMFVPNFGVGLGYNRFATTVDADKESFNGRAKFGYSGLQLFVSGTF